jgi:hypothetical protein
MKGVVMTFNLGDSIRSERVNRISVKNTHVKTFHTRNFERKRNISSNANLQKAKDLNKESQ